MTRERGDARCGDPSQEHGNLSTWRRAPLSMIAITPMILAVALTFTWAACAKESVDQAHKKRAQSDEMNTALAAGDEDKSDVPATRSFRFEASTIDAVTARRMTGVSYRDGCPVPLSRLRLVSLSIVDDKGIDRLGALVVHQSAVEDLRYVFSRLFEARFPISRMEVIETFAGNDDASMAANNTSAFNCRPKAGRSKGFSTHSYGRAIDINPLVNPYVSRRGVQPKAGKRYADRTVLAQGGIGPESLIVRLFRERGWAWGGNWRRSKDYQHFEKLAGR